MATHLGDHEDASDGRLSRWYRFYKNNNDFGETRISYLESKYKKRLTADLKNIGLTPKFTDGTKVYTGFDIDTKNSNSPYKNMSEGEVKTALEKKGYKVTSVTKDANGKVNVSIDGTYSQKISTTLLTKELGYSGISAAIRSRPLDKYGLVSWHPLKIVDKKFNASVEARYDKWSKEREKRLNKSKKSGEITNKTATRSNPDAPDQEIPAGGDLEGEVDEGKTKETLDKLRTSKSFAAAGGLAAVTGIVCSVNQIRESWHEIRWASVFAPPIALGMETITESEQGKSGDDIDMEVIGFAARKFDEYNDKGKMVSSHNQSKAYRNDTGQAGGHDLSQRRKTDVQWFCSRIHLLDR